MNLLNARLNCYKSSVNYLHCPHTKTNITKSSLLPGCLFYSKNEFICCEKPESPGDIICSVLPTNHMPSLFRDALNFLYISAFTFLRKINHTHICQTIILQSEGYVSFKRLCCLNSTHFFYIIRNLITFCTDFH